MQQTALLRVTKSYRTVSQVGVPILTGEESLNVILREEPLRKRKYPGKNYPTKRNKIILGDVNEERNQRWVTATKRFNLKIYFPVRTRL